MHDQLDLDALAQQTTPPAKKDSRLRTLGIIVLAALFYLLFNFMSSQPTAFFASSSLLLVIASFVVVVTLAIAFLFIPRYRRNIAHMLRAREILNPLVPTPRLVYSRRFPWLVTILIGTLTGAASVTMYRAMVAEWDSMIVVLLAAAALEMTVMSVDLFLVYPRMDSGGRAFVRGRIIDWTTAIALVVFFLAIFPAGFWQALNPFGGSLMLLTITYSVGVLALLGVFHANAVLPARWTFGGPLTRGDYDGALRRVDLLLRLRPLNILFKSWRGYLLLLAGRYDDAELLWLDILRNPHSGGGMLGIAASNFGYGLMGQTRFDDALPYLEAGIRMTPELGSIYSGVATYYMRQNIEPERALSFMRRAVELTPRPKKLKGMEAYFWSSLLGSQAVAAALSGDVSLTDNSLNQAFADNDPRFLPGVAALHYDAGRVARIRGDTAGADSHFTRAAELDPHGHVGKVAARARQMMEASERVVQYG